MTLLGLLAFLASLALTATTVNNGGATSSYGIALPGKGVDGSNCLFVNR